MSEAGLGGRGRTQGNCRGGDRGTKCHGPGARTCGLPPWEKPDIEEKLPQPGDLLSDKLKGLGDVVCLVSVESSQGSKTGPSAASLWSLGRDDSPSPARQHLTSANAHIHVR